MKGKIPAWFKELETKILDNVNGNTRKIKNEYIGRIEKSNIHINYFDENERQEKNTIVSWNDYGEFPVFAEDKKDHIVCESCDRNVSKKKDSKICLIYLENKNSRIIETRRKEGAIKPYEILNNLIKKNEWIKKFNNEERMNEEYNERIEKIDNLIKSEEFITIIKNSGTKFTGCWPELKHSAGLGFRNSGQDPISTGIQKITYNIYIQLIVL
ncbi:hypothetical protein RhiirA4_427419 [Rhizophagus irregularis]|uniref:Uncharacterized protein n=1 Tax=Rhizophagus irregularis TaxID=588596 RepID=A0A2I1H8X3_9GLOM|nr:hypothetical protein RhiirA4_427419 [Rhizophagus irregularis]